MFEIDIEREFSAAHFLRGYNGDCSSLHGHNWVVQAYAQADDLDEIGIALDFRSLKREIDDILSKLDHVCLNEIEAFKNMNPTSENLAKHIFEELSRRLNSDSVKVSKVRVCESPGSGATYSA